MTKGTLAQEFWDKFSEEEQKAIKRRAAKRIEQYHSLQKLRKSNGITQTRVPDSKMNY